MIFSSTGKINSKVAKEFVRIIIRIIREKRLTVVAYPVCYVIYYVYIRVYMCGINAPRVVLHNKSGVGRIIEALI